MTYSRLAPKSRIGRKGEDIAARYLKDNGYKLLERNYRTKFGELDIVAEEIRSGLLVFIEVKTLAKKLSSLKGLVPEDNISWRKLRALQRIAQFFANKHPELIGDQGWRIDLFTISFLGADRCRVRHYENI